MKIHIETYGCFANKAESEMMAGILFKNHEIVGFDEAELVIINSCVIKAVTEQKLLNRIKEIDKPIIVAGCAPETIKEKLLKIRPDAKLIGTGRISEIEKVINGERELLGMGEDKVCLPRIGIHDANIILISQGCLGDCKYCIAKRAKGNLHSYPVEKIIEEIGGLYAKEIRLTSQDCACYGFDIGTNLVELLKRIADAVSNIKYIGTNQTSCTDIRRIGTCGANFIGARFARTDIKIKIGMMNPENVLKILDELVGVYKHEKIVKFLHIPVQSGDNNVLKRMSRRYSVDDFEKIVNTFRRQVANIRIWTDIIVGYPGETEKEFENTVEFLKRNRFDYVNVSRFAKRDGTETGKLKQLDTKEMKRRTKIVSEIVKS